MPQGGKKCSILNELLQHVGDDTIGFFRGGFEGWLLSEGGFGGEELGKEFHIWGFPLSRYGLVNFFGHIKAIVVGRLGGFVVIVLPRFVVRMKLNFMND